MKEKVLQALKPKTASLGFTNEELESAANSIAGTLQEDATEEQINAQIDAVIPFLKLSQSAVNRIVNAKKKEEKQPKAPEASTTEEAKKGANPEEKKNDEMPAWAKALNQKIDALVNKDVTTTRRAAYATKLKSLPEEIQKTKLKDFDRMSFQDQEDFDAFLAETDEDIPNIVQGLANKGLSEMGKPIVGGKASKDKPSDEELKKVFG